MRSASLTFLPLCVVVISPTYGLLNVVVDSGVVAPGIVDGVIRIHRHRDRGSSPPVFGEVRATSSLVPVGTTSRVSSIRVSLSLRR